MIKKSRVSIVELARELNVSASTVSRALNDNSSISIDMRNRVKETAQRLGYVPNQSAIKLQSGKNRAIGVIVPNISRNFFSTAIDGIEECASQSGYEVLICQSKDDAEREMRHVQSVCGRVDGIVVSPAAHEEDFSYFKDLHIPLVFFDRVRESIAAASVTLDDQMGGYMATKHLLDRGAKRVYHYAGLQCASMWRGRLEGYRQAMAEQQIEIQSNWIWESTPTLAEGERFARHLCECGEPLPEAIFFAGDYAAIGAATYFEKRGVMIPMVGFANEPICELVKSPLTSIDQFSFQMGQLACQTLLDILAGEPTRNSVIRPQLIIR